ncbi:MAG TPA: cytochrome d ubiquinol oxidase subunit II [Solirubrobacteraceae bacterium]
MLLALALWAGLPLVTGVALPALYIPLMLMLWSPIACGVANELIDQQDTGWHPFWGKVFGIGSLLAAFCQGAAFGGLIAGLNVYGPPPSSAPFTFLHHGYAVLTGLTAVTLYVLEGELGSSRHRRGQRACPQRRRRLAAILRLTRGGSTHGGPPPVNPLDAVATLRVLDDARYANLVRVTMVSVAVGVIAVTLCGGIIGDREHIDVVGWPG